MSSCGLRGGLGQHLSRSETLRFSFLHSATRPENPPHFVSFQARPAPSPLRSTLNDTVCDQTADAMTFYELLGIPETGSLLEIKQAYRQLARKYHPDVSPPGRVEEYTRRFVQVQEAYETLSDPRRRELYERSMATGFHLAFTGRRRGRFDKDMEDKTEWHNQWQSQLSELNSRSMQKETTDNMSWGARIRRERNQSS